MFYELEVKSHIRIPPNLFGEGIKEAIFMAITNEYAGSISRDFGFILAVSDVTEIGDGVLVPGDSSAYYIANFKLIVYKPELQEVILGKVGEITDFGAFLDCGVFDGMIHISQTMDDFVSFSKSGTLTGKETKRVLKAGDKCKARIIAVSYKDAHNPKIGLTMRQPTLGVLNWEPKSKIVDKKREKAGKPEKAKGGKAGK